VPLGPSPTGFTTSTIGVASAGDMAYEIGDGALMVTGSDGKSQTEKASYVVFWAKQPEGRWKVLVDVPDKAT
jgi:ketosteroid isomerase-like protein